MQPQSTCIRREHNCAPVSAKPLEESEQDIKMHQMNRTTYGVAMSGGAMSTDTRHARSSPTAAARPPSRVSGADPSPGRKPRSRDPQQARSHEQHGSPRRFAIRRRRAWRERGSVEGTTPSLRTRNLSAKIRWLKLSGEFPMGLGIPPLNIKIMLESDSVTNSNS